MLIHSKPKLRNSLDQLIGDSNISYQESRISKASSSSKTAIRVEFTNDTSELFD